MIRLYFDEDVDGNITRGLRRHGIDIITVVEDGRTGSPDNLVLDRATELDRVLFSQDTDLLAKAADRQRRGIPFPGLIYAHPLHVPIGQCVSDLHLLAQAGLPEDLRDAVTYLPLR